MEEERSCSVVLALDGMHFQQACALADAASSAEAEFSKWQGYVQETNAEIDPLIEERDDDEESNYELTDKIHDLCVVLNRHWESFNFAADALVQSVAATHILCGSALESHINMRAEEVLATRDFEEFDKLSLTGKWLLYPKLISVGSFNPGTKPFQDLQKLVSRRNALVHYKVRREKTKQLFDMPSLIEDLGLRAVNCRESLSAVRDMVRALAKVERREAPDWLRDRWGLAFNRYW
jgi:hypothetical protein